MSILAASLFPGAEHRPLDYPGIRPEYSYVYYREEVYPLVRGISDPDLWVEDHAGQVPLDQFLTSRGNAGMARRHPVLAVGSNGCPGRLAEKYADDPDVAVPVLVGTLANTAVVYTRHLTHYGALPATYLQEPRAVSRLSVTMLTVGQAATMDKTEAVGQLYTRVQVPDRFQVEGGPELAGLTAYLDRDLLNYQGEPVLLEAFAGHGPGWPVMDERGVLDLVFNAGGLAMEQSIENRHRTLASASTRRTLSKIIETHMGGLTATTDGRISPS